MSQRQSHEVTKGRRKYEGTTGWFRVRACFVPSFLRGSAFLVMFVLAIRTNAQPTTAPGTLPSTKPAFEIVGSIDAPEIPESSGIVESRKYPGVFWTHNDSGNPAEVFAITRSGKLLMKFSIRAANVDWEDIAIDDAGHLYLADIGDNSRTRTQIQVYRIAEPDPRMRANTLVPDRIYQLTYPQQAFDAESLFLLGDDGYIISKNRDMSPAMIYRFSLKRFGAPQTMAKVIDLPTRFPVTAADVSRDGKQLAIMTVAGPSVFQIDGDVSNVRRGAFWSALFLDSNIEGVCFIDGGLLATTEGRRVIFFPHRPPPASQPAN